MRLTSSRDFGKVNAHFSGDPAMSTWTLRLLSVLAAFALSSVADIAVGQTGDAAALTGTEQRLVEAIARNRRWICSSVP